MGKKLSHQLQGTWWCHIPQGFWCKEYSSLYLLIFITVNTNWSRRKIQYVPLLPLFMAKYRNPMEPVGKFLLSKGSFITQSSLHRKTRPSDTTEMPGSGSGVFREVWPEFILKRHCLLQCVHSQITACISAVWQTAHRIAQSQNVRGWKWPLWVV